MNILPTFQYAYFGGTLVLLFIWFAFFLIRKDLRREMLTISGLLGFLSVVTAHYWWTVDWWRPTTITGTSVGVEDFLMGFASGGIMAVAYEILFRKRLYRKITEARVPDPFTLLLLLAFLTSWLFWGVGLTSFYASALAMLATATVLFYFRGDLFINGAMSGFLMAAISLLFYFAIVLLSPDWVHKTYQFKTLSGFLVVGVPIEEFVFWFLAGLIFGPFYENLNGDGLRKMVGRPTKAMIRERV